jgi:hypothetical protein
MSDSRSWRSGRRRQSARRKSDRLGRPGAQGKGVEIATSQIEDERRNLQEWQGLIGNEAGRRVSETVQALRAENRGLRQELSAIFQALHGNPHYEGFRNAYLQHERADRHTERFVKKVRRDIESGSNEFGSDDAVLKSPTQG